MCWASPVSLNTLNSSSTTATALSNKLPSPSHDPHRHTPRACCALVRPLHEVWRWQRRPQAAQDRGSPPLRKARAHTPQRGPGLRSTSPLHPQDERTDLRLKGRCQLRTLQPSDRHFFQLVNWTAEDHRSTAPTVYTTHSRPICTDDVVELPVGADGVHCVFESSSLRVKFTAATPQAEVDGPTRILPQPRGSCDWGEDEAILGLQADTADLLLGHFAKTAAARRAVGYTG